MEVLDLGLGSVQKKKGIDIVNDTVKSDSVTKIGKDSKKTRHHKRHKLNLYEWVRVAAACLAALQIMFAMFLVYSENYLVGYPNAIAGILIIIAALFVEGFRPWNEMKRSMKILLVYLWLNFVAGIWGLFTVSQKSEFFLGFIVHYPYILFISPISVLITAIALIGLHKARWRKLIIGLFSFSAVNLISVIVMYIITPIDQIFILLNREVPNLTADVMQEAAFAAKTFAIIPVAINLLIVFLIIYYVYRRRDYFKQSFKLSKKLSKNHFGHGFGHDSGEVLARSDLHKRGHSLRDMAKELARKSKKSAELKKEKLKNTVLKGSESKKKMLNEENVLKEEDLHPEILAFVRKKFSEGHVMKDIGKYVLGKGFERNEIAKVIHFVKKEVMKEKEKLHLERVKFIKNNLANGYSLAEVRDYILRLGHNVKDVEKAILDVEKF